MNVALHLKNISFEYILNPSEYTFTLFKMRLLNYFCFHHEADTEKLFKIE